MTRAVGVPAWPRIPADERMSHADHVCAEARLREWLRELAQAATSAALERCGDHLAQSAQVLGHRRYWEAVGHWADRTIALHEVQP